MLAQAQMVPAAEMEHGSLHPARRLRIYEPTLRAIDIAILAKRVLITVYNPGVTSHNSTARNIIPTDGASRPGHDTFKRKAESRVHTECFLNASGKIWQLASLGERDPSGLKVCVQLFSEFRIAAGGA